MGALAQGERVHGRWARGASRHTGAGRAGRAGARGAGGRRMLGRRAAAGQARGRRARAAGGHALQARGRQARGAQQARGARPAGRPGCDLGVQLDQWVVHLVHSACFDPV